MHDDPREVLWQNLARQLPNSTERLVCYCAFVLQMSPRAILAHCPDQFHGTEDIYAVKRTVLGRLSSGRASESS
jgi:hypothetical protein